jgi:putative mRNA 3-end processing factor
LISKLLKYTKQGLYCPQADLFIDPSGKAEKAVITHAHSDHARRGSKFYLAHPVTSALIKHRLGKNINTQDLNYGDIININGIKVSLHPAGHVPGSSQVRLEGNGEIAVVSGDYKIENDGLSEPFEPVKCDVFVTESTFALPIYQWEKQEIIYDRINQWWNRNKRNDIITVIGGYSIGKAQRITSHLDTSIGKIYAHRVIEDVNNILRANSLKLPETFVIDENTSYEELIGNLIIAPPSFTPGSLIGKKEMYSVGYASGWLKTNKAWGRQSIDIGFALSDHADWPGLNIAIKSTGAEKIYVTHGFTKQFVKWLNDNGQNAYELNESDGKGTGN